MAAHGRKFSFSRLISNAIPNFANDGRDDVDLAPPIADQLVRYQLSLPRPPYLGNQSFKMGGITDSESLSKKVYASLVKIGIVIPAPPVINPIDMSDDRGAGVTGGGEASTNKTDEEKDFGFGSTGGLTVRTDLITKDFANKMAVISVHAQRKVVGMLFFWENECMRLMQLAAEEEEVLVAMELRKNGEQLPNYDGSGRRGSAGDDELEMRLKGVRMRRRQVPSQRAEVTQNVTRGVVGESLPGYT